MCLYVQKGCCSIAKGVVLKICSGDNIPDSIAISQFPSLYFIWRNSPASMCNHISVIELIGKVEMDK